MEPVMEPLMVAAIDFGTTYSGWAYSFKQTFENEPTKIFAKNWTGEQLVSAKAPTCVLINPDGKQLDSFGYEAETKYGVLSLEGNHKEWFYFRRFKMILYDKMKIQRDVTLEDETGKRLSAKAVFSLAIKFLKEDLIEVCRKQLVDVLTEKDIQWVLTVPAIWNDGAKQFMREAAEDAGIQSSKLMIALEPEVASLYCRYLPVQKHDEDNSLVAFKPGTKYVVLDAGGGTVDVTVHQVIVDGKLREVHRASGNALGGTMVDKAYEKFLQDIVGRETIQQFKNEHLDDYIDLFRTFEIKKREISPTLAGKVIFRLPSTMVSTALEANGESFVEKLLHSPYKNDVTFKNGKLIVNSRITKLFFTESFTGIVQHVTSLLKKKANRDCAAIVMVGGYSESKILQSAIKSKFGGNLKVIIPEEAGLAVLKGAVLFGHRPSTISERICKYTYGQQFTHITSANCNHQETRTGIENGHLRCFDIFLKYITIGESVKLEEEQLERVTYPLYADQTIVSKNIYASTSPNPCLVTEPGCIKIGHFKIPIPDTSLGTDRQIGTMFIFGGTEIAVKVEDKSTGKIYIHSVDFLE